MFNDLTYRSMKVSEAVRFAAQKHAGQTDKHGEPYILHPLRVMLSVREHGPDYMVAAVLHDVVEDCGVSLEEIAVKFGYDIAGAVRDLSHRKGESYMAFVARAKANPIARVVKIADIQDNSLAWRVKPEWAGKQEQYKRALEFLVAA